MQPMRPLSRITNLGCSALVFLGPILTGCGAANNATVPPAPVHDVAAMPSKKAFANSGYLYAAMYHGMVSVYAPGGSKPKLTLTKGICNPIAVLFDKSNNVYVVSQQYPGGCSGSVSEYAPNGSTPLRTFAQGLQYPEGAAIDSSGRVYISNAPTGAASVYNGASGKLLETITNGINGAGSVAVDSSQNVYIANFTSGAVTVYAPGQTSPTRAIFTPVLFANGLVGRTLRFDPSGNLYVSNTNNTITVYAPGQTTPSRTISTGVSQAMALAVGPKSSLYVANCGCQTSTVSAFAQGGSTPIRSYKSYTGYIRDIAVDRSGELFVAPSGGTPLIAVFRPNSTKLSRLIKTGIVNNAVSLSIAP
jgi:WD40 repeat protein